MKKLIAVTFIVQMFFLNNLFPCSVIFYSDKNVCLAGNNEDSFMPYTQILFLPAESGKYGCVYFGYYSKNCPDFGDKQGGMNEKGLFFDGLSLPPKAVLKSANKPTYLGLLMEKVLEECATVEEAIKLIEKYNLSILTTGQTFIADRTGDAAIIEGDTIIRKKGNWLAATNFRLSEVKNNQFPCQRYNTIKKMFDTNPYSNIDNIRDILNSAHQEGEGPTIYSNICDLKNSDIYLYHFYNYKNVVKFSLTEELKKGKHTLIIESLFPEDPAFVSFEQTQRKAFEDLKNSRQKLYETFMTELLKTSNDLEANVTGESVLDKYSEVIGGKKGREYIKTLTTKGNITSSLVIGSYVGNYSGTLLSYKNSIGKCFQRIDLSGLIIIEKATDGKTSWERSSYQPYKLLSGIQNKAFIMESLIESNYKDLYKKVTYLGNTEIEGNVCYKVLCETNAGYTVAKYFDKISGLQRAELFVINDSIDGPTKTWTILDNYNNSMLFPNTVKISITTQTPFAIQTSNLKIDLDYILNAPVAENLFIVPEELNK